MAQFFSKFITLAKSDRVQKAMGAGSQLARSEVTVERVVLFTNDLESGG
jgi:hypothetical protein